MSTEPIQVANTWLSSANALNAGALPDGSSKNIVDRSRTAPTERVWGSITNAVSAAMRRPASARHVTGSSSTPKCGTGTFLPSTEWDDLSISHADRWATYW